MSFPEKKLLLDSEDWAVYRALSGGWIGWPWFLPLSLAAIPLIQWTGNRISRDRFLFWAFLLALPGILRYLLLYARLCAGYPRFRSWRTRLPFALEGWESWVNAPHFTRFDHWRLHASVTVEGPDGAKIDVENLLKRFCLKANRFFYGPSSAIWGARDDPREKWKVKGNRAEGSLNHKVASVFYRSLAKDLARWAKRRGISLRVMVEADPGQKEWKIPYAEPNAGS